MLYQNTFRKPTSIKHALVCCFCKFTLTRSHKYSNVSRVTLKCSFQIKLALDLLSSIEASSVDEAKPKLFVSVERFVDSYGS